ncbi:hypothetical protein [Pandoravirus japonicus]|uniref:Uncharacterized protein n=1 Tax=Pandoravirus japonicus TaxID=2823154 RepID=A0A811BLI2_9VIRU|nr:hypothetical protein [Pandoravirus japonicus]
MPRPWPLSSVFSCGVLLPFAQSRRARCQRKINSLFFFRLIFSYSWHASTTAMCRRRRWRRQRRVRSRTTTANQHPAE